METAVERVPVKYIGHRPEYRDGAYGTGIVFKQGESKMVPADKAKAMLRHADVYAPGKAKGAGTPDVKPELPSEDTDAQYLRDTIQQMGKKDLAAFAKTHFAGFVLDQSKAVEALRTEVTGLVDQYGVH